MSGVDFLERLLASTSLSTGDGVWVEGVGLASVARHCELDPLSRHYGRAYSSRHYWIAYHRVITGVLIQRVIAGVLTHRVIAGLTRNLSRAQI